MGTYSFINKPSKNQQIVRGDQPNRFAPRDADLQYVTNNGATTNKIITVPGIKYNTSATPATETPGLTQWNATEDTLDLVTLHNIYQLGQELAPLYKNQTGSTIPNACPVMANGSLGASGRIKMVKAIADGTYDPSTFIGLTTEEVINGDDGKATWFGKVRNVDTTGTPYGETWAEGDKLYVSPTTAGYLTNVKPDAPNYQIFVGKVINVHANNGTIFVKPSWNPKLEDLSDIDGSAPTTTGDLLTYDQSSGVWERGVYNINDYATLSSLTGYVPYTGATGDVDLGYYKILGSEFVSNTGGFKMGNFTGYGGTEITTSDIYGSGWSVLRMFPKTEGASSIEFYRNDPIASGYFGDFSRMRWDANYANPGHYTFISEATGAETVGNIYWNIAGNNYGAMTAMGSLIWGSPYDFGKGYSFQTQKAWVGSDFPAYSFTTTAFNVVQDLANGAVDCMTVVANDAGDSLNTGFFIKADLYNQYGIHIPELISVNANTGGPAPISFNGEWNGDTTAPVLIHTYTDNGSGAILQVNGSATFSGLINSTGLQSGTLATPPTVNIGDMWADTTTSATHPIVRIRVV